MGPYQLLIFDFDGTLADSGAWMIATYNELAPELGLRPIPRDQVDALRGRSTREIMAQLGVSMWKLPRIAARMRERASADAAQIELFPGVDALLPQLKQRGFTLAVVSSNSEEAVRRILGERNVACIDVFDCSASLFGKARKLRAVMKHTGIAPERTLCIGDETRDIEAAQDAGTDIAAVAWGYASAHALEQMRPTRVVRSLDELASLLTERFVTHL